jgi:hypothetical protein
MSASTIFNPVRRTTLAVSRAIVPRGKKLANGKKRTTMAFIQFLPPSPRAGQRDHVSRETADSLVAAGFAKRIEAELPPAVVTWTVGKSPNTQRFFIIGTCSRQSCATFRYNGPAVVKDKNGKVLWRLDKANGSGVYQFLHQHADGTPEPIPADILEKYAKLKENEAIVVTADEAVFYQESARVGEGYANAREAARLKGLI